MRRAIAKHLALVLLSAAPAGAEPAFAQSQRGNGVGSIVPIHCPAGSDLCAWKPIPGAAPIQPGILLPPSAPVRVRIEPAMMKADPCAAENVTRRAKTPRTGSTVALDEQPLPFEGCTVRCAGASDLCAWNRIPDSQDGGFEAPLAPQ
jgi:hypothetical protein